MPRLLLSLFGLVVLFGVRPETRAAAARPNIVVILSDDMGFSDIGCYGGEIQTPNLDALAKKGVRFTQFYNTARCCPTRASMLTGLYPHQAGVGHMMADRGHDSYRGDLNQRCVTIAEALRPAGYRNYAVGKWHVTRHIGAEGPKHNWPRQRGFDRYYGTIHGAGSYFDPSTLTRDNTPISPFADPEYRPATYYYTDAISDHAIRFVSEHRAQQPDQPFFLYVAYTAAHWPMHALPTDIAKYRGKFDQGYQSIRLARFERMKELGLISKGSAISPQTGDWDRVANPRWEAAGMEVYAAMVDRMDQGIGRIIAELKRTQVFDNTVIFFLQDNGGCAEGMGRAATSEHPETRPNRTTLPALPNTALLPPGSVPPQTREGYPVLMGQKAMPGTADTYMAYGRDWANVSNVPFREYKHWVHEGGISTPLIVHWPEGINARRHGKLEKQPGHLVDVMPTCLDLAGVDYPKDFAGQPIHPLEGVSLRPAFSGRSLRRKEPLFWEHEGNRAIRDGRWKLVAKENQAWELYDLEADRTELNDLATTHRKRANELAAKWEAWASRTKVLPLGTWRGPEDNAGGEFSKETRFVLKHGDHLPRSKAPAIAGRGFTITARFSATSPDGVIVAQGGASHGYTLFLQGGKLTFALRRHGELHSVTAKEASPIQPTVVAGVDSSGLITLSLNGQTVARHQAPGPVAVMPGGGLQVGSDDGSPVGTYAGPNKFGGAIDSLVIELLEQARDHK
jgi:arylsulfatase A-like enzyme